MQNINDSVRLNTKAVFEEKTKKAPALIQAIPADKAFLANDVAFQKLPPRSIDNFYLKFKVLARNQKANNTHPSESDDRLDKGIVSDKNSPNNENSVPVSQSGNESETGQQTENNFPLLKSEPVTGAPIENMDKLITATNNLSLAPDSIEFSRLDSGCPKSPARDVFPLSGDPDFLNGTMIKKTELGHGGSAFVSLVESETTGRQFAFKEFKDPSLLDKEVEAKSAIGSHPNIIKLYDKKVVEGKEGLLMEYIEGADLSDIVDQLLKAYHLYAIDYRLLVGTFQYLLSDILRAIKHMNDKKIAHQDIKLLNIRVNSRIEKMCPVLLDFDHFGHYGDKLDPGMEVYGTPEYFTSSATALITDKVDIYSVGQMCYYFFSGILNLENKLFFTAGADYQSVKMRDRCLLLLMLRDSMTEYQKIDNKGQYKKALNPGENDKLKEVNKLEAKQIIDDPALSGLFKLFNYRISLKTKGKNVLKERTKTEILSELLCDDELKTERNGKEFIEFINQALHPEPRYRLNAEQALEHRFIKEPLCDVDDAKSLLEDLFADVYPKDSGSLKG